MTATTPPAFAPAAPGSVWRSTLFMAGMVPTTVLFALLGLLTFPFPFRWRYAVITQWTTFNLWWLKLTCKVRYEVKGKEHIPAGPAVVLCKHQSAFETMVLQRIFPPHVWLLKRELLWLPFFGWGLAMLEPIAIDRKAGRKALQQLLEIGAKRLAAGRWVVIFPEGTRVAPGQRGRYAPGGAMLAVRGGCPVVPVAHNAGEFWPRRGFIKRPGTIRIVIGPTIDTRGRSAQEVNTMAEQWIEETMATLVERK
jgi:1-acyl-sn-glycerol-3-phosphate acyltransferase